MKKVAVRRIWKAAEREMREAGRSDKTIKNYRDLFAELERRCPGGVYSADAGKEYASRGACSPRYGRMRARVARIADRYVSGETPCTGRPFGGKTVAPKGLEFESLLEGLDGYANDRGLAAKTKSDYRYMASLYLVYLEENGMTSLREVPLATMSAVMGHASPLTTEAYLEADFGRMLECVLPLPKGVTE